MISRAGLEAMNEYELRKALYLIRDAADLLRKFAGIEAKSYIEARELELDLTCELGRRLLAQAKGDLET